MRLEVFGKQRTNKDGKPFTTYLSRITNMKTGEIIPVQIKFRTGVEVPKELPIVLNIEKKNTIEIKNSGCINSMKESRNGDFIVCGNGCDGKNGRWDWDYDSNIGISVIKLFQ